MISRRGFLGAIAAGLTLDPERALWVPGKKLISIPKPGTAVEVVNVACRLLGVLPTGERLNPEDMDWALARLSGMMDRWAREWEAALPRAYEDGLATSSPCSWLPSLAIHGTIITHIVHP